MEAVIGRRAALLSLLITITRATGRRYSPHDALGDETFSASLHILARRRRFDSSNYRRVYRRHI